MSQINAVRTKLAAVWQAQLTTDAITGVNVRKFSPADEMPKTDAAFIANISVNQDDQTMGTRMESLSVSGVVLTFKAGVGDTQADAAEDRALAIFGSLETALEANSTLDGTVIHAQVTDISSDLDAGPDGLYCTLEFSVEIDLTL